MMQQWQDKWQSYSEQYLKITPREQYLIILSGLVAVIFIVFYGFIDSKLIDTQRMTKQVAQLSTSNKSLKSSAQAYQVALAKDHNKVTRDNIAQLEKKLASIDGKLLTLTSELITPVQMRQALLGLLKLEKGVSLLSFELLGAQPLLSKAELSESDDTELNKSKSSNTKSNKASFGKNELTTSQANNEQGLGLNLYRHGIKITLSGNYFELRNYLQQLEKLSWKFFWQEFDLEVKEYPMNELSIEIYSLGSKEAFVGV